MLEVVPTIQRRLATDFRLAHPDPRRGLDRFQRGHPIPEFVPQALFSDLSLPEVEVVLPAATRNDEATIEAMPILQAMRQHPPGRVNRRFGEAYEGLSHWIPIPPGVEALTLPVVECVPVAEPLGTFRGGGPHGETELPVLRPWRIELRKVSSGEARAASNAQPRWFSEFLPAGEPLEIAPPAGTAWQDVAAGMRIHLHQFGSAVRVRRFSDGASAAVVRPRGDTQLVEVRYVDEGRPAALGFEFEDAAADENHADAAGEGEAEHGRAAAGGPGQLNRLRSGLVDRLRSEAVRERLAAALGSLGPGPSRGAFLRGAMEATLADALLQAVASIAPQAAAADALLSDVRPGSEDGLTACWITETTLGGAGVLQAVVAAVAREPRSLYRAVEAAIEAGDAELTGDALERAVQLATEDGEVAEAFRGFRTQLDHSGRDRTRRALLSCLSSRGVQAGRSFVTSLSIRILGPGTGSDSDELCNALISFRNRCERLLGIELDPRETAVLALDDTFIGHLAERIPAFLTAPSRSERVDILAALLWPRGEALRRGALSSWNPYRTSGESDPAVVRHLLIEGGAMVRVDVDGEDWRPAVDAALRAAGIVRIAASRERASSLRGAMVEMQVRPVTVGMLRLHPVLERVTRRGSDDLATFVLEERL